MPRFPRSFVATAPAMLWARLGAVRFSLGNCVGLLHWRHAIAALVAAAILWIGTPSAADALNLDVDTFGDSAAGQFQGCTAAANDCTLRGAILRANAVAGPHTITLPAGTFTISIQGKDDDAALTGDLDIAQNITINGVSPAATVITWDEAIPVANRDRIFHVLSAGNLTVRDLSLRQGASILSSGVSFLNGQGGAILSFGPLTVERASIRINTAGVGGGLSIYGTATIRNSTINNNTSTSSGGGINIQDSFLYPEIPTMLIENSTISTNSSGNGGGLDYNASNTSIVRLASVTITNNSAGSGGGGGLRQLNGGSLFLLNTIVANNTSAGTNPNCSGTILSQGYNLVFGGDTCGMSAGNNDVVNTGNPRLGPLQGNGGPTATHALGTQSAALDAGNPAVPGSGGNACAATDQRGLPRTIDGNSDGIGRCDIGAAEGGRWFAVDTVTDNNALQTCDADPNNGNCSLRGAISLANAAVNVAAVITLPATGAGNPYRLTITGANDDTNGSGDLDIYADITILGGGASTTIVDGNQIDRVFHVFEAGATAHLRLQDLTVQQGNAGAFQGGGILVRAPLSLLRVRVRSNTAADGGGILVANLSTAPTGSPAWIFDSTISGNVANRPSGGRGGGIYQAAASFLRIVNTTVAGNQAPGTGVGGGIAQAAASGGVTLVLENVTLAGNSAQSHGGLSVGRGGIFQNTIVAGNGASASNPNCGGTGTFTSNGFNLVFGGDTCGFTQGTDKQNQDPRLGPLLFNGGTTETMALGGGSAAIDAGNPATPGSGGTSCAAADQRGTPRPINGDIVGGALCDIGAYEAAICTANRPRVTTGVLPGSPGRLSVTVTAGTAVITELRLHALPQTNVQVSIGGLVNQSGELIVPINAVSAQFSIRRTTGVGSGTLPFDVVDGCGVWQSLAGGGPNAWPAGSSAVGEPSAPEPTRAQPATPPPGCSPQRPNVGVATVKQGDGRLQATLSAQTAPGVPTNSLSSVRIGAITNADVTLNGSPVAAGQSVAPPAGAQQATLTVSRDGPDESARRAYGVGFTVTDACGEWTTFVGSGPGG